MAKKRKKKIPEGIFGIVDNSVGNFDNDPFVIKKVEEAKAFLRKVGLPKGFPPLKLD